MLRTVASLLVIASTLLTSTTTTTSSFIIGIKAFQPVSRRIIGSGCLTNLPQSCLFYPRYWSGSLSKEQQSTTATINNMSSTGRSERRPRKSQRTKSASSSDPVPLPPSSSSPVEENTEYRDGDFKLLEDWISHKDAKYHYFHPEEAAHIRQALLSWYYKNRRKLPWRGDAPPFDGSTAGRTNANSAANKNATAKEKKTADNNSKKKKKQGNDYNHLVNAKQIEQSAYGIWVSEIMLQQTRVEAVIPYWIKWMEAFPTVQALANATEEQVNAHWAGLGFYRRARLLHQGAKHIVDTRGKDGEFPKTVQELRTIPGIGPYTAGAIASIAFDVCTPVVDGNVCRVLARLKGVANHIKAPAFKDKLAWDLAEQIVEAGDGSCAGDVNQALMELGATYCAPSGTGTDEQDPLKDFYLSTQLGLQYYKYAATKSKNTIATDRIHSLLRESSQKSTCELCDSNGKATVLGQLSEALNDQIIDASDRCEAARRCGHSVFPISPPKLSKREEVLSVGAIACSPAKSDKETHWLLVKRPKEGLLAGQWEFPNVCVWSSSDEQGKTNKGTKRKTPTSTKANQSTDVPAIPSELRRSALLPMLRDLIPEKGTPKLSNVGTSPMEHVFSHVRHTMWVDYATLNITRPITSSWISPDGREVRWMTLSDMQEAGVTSGVKKILKAVKEERQKNMRKQTFFQPKK